MIAWGRGALLPLLPKGLGTALIEGLSSYVVRLAVAHVVPTRLLLPELFSQAYGDIRREPMLGRYGVWLNGMGTTAQNVVRGLEDFTLQPMLDRLTLLALRELFPPRRLLAQRRRWCPLCYARMRAEHGECWDPLLWSLAPVLWCPWHGRALADVCVSCERTQPWLPRDTSLGWCAWCGHDLAGRRGFRRRAASARRIGSDDKWKTQVCADLVTALGRSESPVHRTQLVREVATLVQRYDGGNCSAFARRLGLSLGTSRCWVAGCRPRFDRLLFACCRLDHHPCSLIFEHFAADSALAQS